MEEVWKVIDFDTRYSISNYGNIISRVGGIEKLICPYINNRGYYSVTIKRKNYSVHRLVALFLFRHITPLLHIDHIDGK